AISLTLSIAAPQPDLECTATYSDEAILSTFQAHSNQLRFVLLWDDNAPVREQLSILQQFEARSSAIIPIFANESGPCSGRFLQLLRQAGVPPPYFRMGMYGLPMLKALGVGESQSYPTVTPTMWIFNCDGRYLGKWDGVQPIDKLLQQFRTLDACSSV